MTESVTADDAARGFCAWRNRESFPSDMFMVVTNADRLLDDIAPGSARAAARWLYYQAANGKHADTVSSDWAAEDVRAVARALARLGRSGRIPTYEGAPGWKCQPRSLAEHGEVAAERERNGILIAAGYLARYLREHVPSCSGVVVDDNVRFLARYDAHREAAADWCREVADDIEVASLEAADAGHYERTYDPDRGGTCYDWLTAAELLSGSMPVVVTSADADPVAARLDSYDWNDDAAEATS